MNHTTIETATYWERLKALPSASIPDDLSEIDADFCYYSLEQYAHTLSEDTELDRLPWEILRGFAYDLRDLWHTARAEAAQFAQG